MMNAKHKFFDSPAVLQPSYREVSRYSTNSVLNTQQQMNKHGNGEQRAHCDINIKGGIGSFHFPCGKRRNE